MSYRLITFPITELILDPEAIAQQLTHACVRRTGNGRYHVTGVCQSRDHVCFPCEEAGEGPTLRYVIVPVNADTTEELSADLHTRWASGFSTLGIIYLPEGYLGVYAIPDKAKL